MGALCLFVVPVVVSVCPPHLSVLLVQTWKTLLQEVIVHGRTQSDLYRNISSTFCPQPPTHNALLYILYLCCIRYWLVTGSRFCIVAGLLQIYRVQRWKSYKDRDALRGPNSLLLHCRTAVLWIVVLGARSVWLHVTSSRFRPMLTEIRTTHLIYHWTLLEQASLIQDTWLTGKLHNMTRSTGIAMQKSTPE